MVFDAWQLAKPYWISEDKKWAWGLLLTVIGLNLSLVFVNVRLSYWQNDLFNALQKLDAKIFFEQFGLFALLAASYVGVGVYQTYLKQLLHLRWRRWLTKRYLDNWLTQKTYYHLQLGSNETDNPDQRIAEDLDRFTDVTLTLGLGLLNASVTLFSFLGILWSLSGPLMIWVALIYAGLGTWITIKLGRPLIKLNFEQQHYEADFRFSLVRLRENTEAIALYNGEHRETAIFEGRFAHIIDNFRAIMNRTKNLGLWTYSYSQLGFIFPFIVASPRYFAGQIQLGDLMQISKSFQTVQGALFFVIDAYANIANWQSVVARLIEFDDRVHSTTTTPKLIKIKRDGEGISTQRLVLNLPNGSNLLRDITLNIQSGEALLITGPTGSGKSTFLRAMAGIWPYGTGDIRLAPGETMFLPQKPYLPLGTLRQVFCYPDQDDNQLAQMIDRVGLSALVEKLDEIDNWSLRLSLGEQQRIAFARVLIRKPKLLFLDESTSALDESSEAQFYQMLRDTHWQPTIISVGHRSTLRAFHDRLVQF